VAQCPATLAARAPQIEAFEHEGEFTGIELHALLPGGRFGRNLERSSLETLVEQQIA
jgi:hypothetical protein